MLSQVNLWVERAGMVLDLILMLRLLKLKLPNTYLFVTLYALLALFYDAIELWLGAQSDAFVRVSILSRFIYAVVFPLAAWDLFEEARPAIEKLRRLAMSRMISSLLFISLWGLLIAAFTGGDDNNQLHYVMRVALVVWTGSVAAALAFLWVMKRGIKASQVPLPHNTSVFFRYFQLLLIVEGLSCILYLILPSIQVLAAHFADALAQGSEPVLNMFAIFLTAWCVFKIRSVPMDVPDVPSDASA